jgi:hypothetical protein
VAGQPILGAHLAQLKEMRTIQGWQEQGLIFPLGTNPRTVMEILRHTDFDDLNIYAHSLPNINREAANALGELIKPRARRLQLARWSQLLFGAV